MLITTPTSKIDRGVLSPLRNRLVKIPKRIVIPIQGKVYLATSLKDRFVLRREGVCLVGFFQTNSRFVALQPIPSNQLMYRGFNRGIMRDSVRELSVSIVVLAILKQFPGAKYIGACPQPVNFFG